MACALFRQFRTLTENPCRRSKDFVYEQADEKIFMQAVARVSAVTTAYETRNGDADDFELFFIHDLLGS